MSVAQKPPASGTAASRGGGSPIRRLGLEIVLVGIVLLYGGALRLEALHHAYPPPAEAPAALRWIEGAIAGAIGTVRPTAEPIEPQRYPYRFDAKSYLDAGREMDWFYEGRLREPLFVYATKVSLAALGDQDRGVSLASTICSILMLLPVWLIGRLLGGPATGVLAAALLAVEPDLIHHGTLGLRAELFTLTLLAFAATALLYLRSPDEPGRGFLMGVAGAAAVLTRITAVSFVVPTLAWLWLVNRRRRGSRQVVVAGALVVALVVPYLVACWVELGDPLYSINWHTGFYNERASGEAEREGIGSFLVDRGTEAPLRTADTLLRGLTVYPWDNKFDGVRTHYGNIALGALRALALLGLALWLWSPGGRLLLLTYLTSLLPFAITWEVPGGAQWRFTLHAEPYFLIAAAFAAVTLARTSVAGARGEWRLDRWRPVAVRALLTVAGAGALVLVIAAFPLVFVVTDVADGRPTSIAAGGRDGFYFDDGWHPPERRGAVTYRDSRASRATLWFPSPGPRPIDLFFRLDSIPESPGVKLEATLNGTALGRIDLVADPADVGRYWLHVPPDALRRGGNDLEISLVGPAGEAPPRIAFWYLRLFPEGAAHE